jgi:hypothetical protein
VDLSHLVQAAVVSVRVRFTRALRWTTNGTAYGASSHLRNLSGRSGATVRRLARSPSLHFVALGAVLVATNAAWSRLAAGEARGSATIVVSAADVQQLRRSFTQQYGRAPRADEEAALVDRSIDDEVLYRRALEIGLDRNNRVVRERLVAVMRMLADDPKQNDEALYREALAMRLDRTDLVVRRHLVQLMTLLLRRSAPAVRITDADLDRLLARDADRYRLAGQVTLTQVYLDPARRGGSLDSDAQRILGELRSGMIAPDDAAALGDPFLLGSRFVKRSQAELPRLLGDGFARAVADAPLREWSGPVRSSYGVHLVLVEDRVAGRMPAASQVRNQLVGRYLEERADATLHAKLAEMRRRYVVEIDRNGQSPAPTANTPDGVVLSVASPVRELGD